ncbi:MAG: sigma-70 family RNA polymerase sigma factor [Rhodobacteraceae bacterium]|nr:sigma-70 family RNA polymerase sigma factor [Paracoccaceae bacterium]
MKRVDRLVCIPGNSARPTTEPDGPVLSPAEIRLIFDGRLEQLADFAASSRLHRPDPKGDTPLHLASRMGNIGVCALFIRSGADPASLNHDRQTPADVARIAGHGRTAQFLSSRIGRITETETGNEHREATGIGHPSARIKEGPAHRSTVAQETGQKDQIDDFDDLLRIDLLGLEPNLATFPDHSTVAPASGADVAHISLDNPGGNWNQARSPAQTTGESTGTRTTVAREYSAGYSTRGNFSNRGPRGRRSIKRAVIQTGTQLMIDPVFCATWVKEILAKGWCSFDDIEHLVAQCGGDGDVRELCINVQRNLEAAGFDLEQTSGYEAGCRDICSDISSDDLTEAITAALTRGIRLPGTPYFSIDQSDERKLLAPMIRARQNIQSGILASAAAVESILGMVDGIRDGVLRPVMTSRPDYAERPEILTDAKILRSWYAKGRVMNGKQPKEARAALDLCLAFHNELIHSLARNPAYQAQASRLDADIQTFESAARCLICEYLPRVRRFASRNVKNGEEIEDVFQIAVMGLHRAIRGFNPELSRFPNYATYWMWNSITRWRETEGVMLRIPSAWHKEIARFDRALDRLGVQGDGAVSDQALAAELTWTIDRVKWFREIPRVAEYPATADDWDALMSGTEDAHVLDQSKIAKILADMLAELPEREATVIRMRFGIGHKIGMTLAEIGEIYGLTRERIRQISVRGLEHLCHPARKQRLRILLGM